MIQRLLGRGWNRKDSHYYVSSSRQNSKICKQAMFLLGVAKTKPPKGVQDVSKTVFQTEAKESRGGGDWKESKMSKIKLNVSVPQLCNSTEISR